MKRTLWLIFATLIGAILFYVSRFWDFRLWPRDGLFGIEALRPQGGLVGQWLRGTDLAPFELLIWAIGAFLILTLLQKLYDLLNPPPE
ncbi:hypothetical protein [Tateyamaria sp. ANG-S1]|uniref:hypothetical protein n=1 Tax=Tateyamaria sp. ANG-S1 TaxID=1577905 RepID=UPI000580338C|nr:hypothetical protein [Tateyamaria sp. ANG-S1]KIC48375.1 hypothetical protein RA29_11365 [Tateyamaria sp. ANG-S1]